MKMKIHADGSQKEMLSISNDSKGIMTFIERIVPLPGNFKEEYMKIKSQLTPIKEVLGQFCLHTR